MQTTCQTQRWFELLALRAHSLPEVIIFTTHRVGSETGCLEGGAALHPSRQCEARVATCKNTNAIERARSPSRRGAPSAGASKSLTRIAMHSRHGAAKAGTSVSLACLSIQGEACVATCTDTIAHRRARSTSSRGATSADASVGLAA